MRVLQRTRIVEYNKISILKKGIYFSDSAVDEKETSHLYFVFFLDVVCYMFSWRVLKAPPFLIRMVVCRYLGKTFYL